MGRVLRFTLIGCGGVIALVVLIGIVGAIVGDGTQPSSPPERAEQDEGLEGGGREPEEAGQGSAGEAKAAQEGQEQEQQGEGEDRVIFRVTGDPGLGFQGTVGNMETQRSIQGTTPQDFPLRGVDLGAFSDYVVSGNAQKMGPGTERLTVQIVVDGEVVKAASTSAEYGLAQVSWSPAE